MCTGASQTGFKFPVEQEVKPKNGKKEEEKLLIMQKLPRNSKYTLSGIYYLKGRGVRRSADDELICIQNRVEELNKAVAGLRNGSLNVLS